MLRLAFDFIITWRETRTRPNAYEKKGFETRNDVKVKTNGNVRMDYMISQDKKFVAAQLFRFIPYTYEPASSVFYFTGDDASAFVHCLETSEF